MVRCPGGGIMKLLAFDTATEACSVALWLDGSARERVEMHNQHSERLLTMIDMLLAEAGMTLSQLDAIAFGRGPGSFTGLRIGAGVAQGLAFAAGLPVAPVSSLAALAQGVEAGRILAAIDARMQQVYWGAFLRNDEGVVQPQVDEAVLSPERIVLPDDAGWIGAGSGWDAYAPVLTARFGNRVQAWRPGRYPTAIAVALLAATALRSGPGMAAEAVAPVYIRDEVAEKKKSGH